MAHPVPLTSCLPAMPGISGAVRCYHATLHRTPKNVRVCPTLCPTLGSLGFGCSRTRPTQGASLHLSVIRNRTALGVEAIPGGTRAKRAGLELVTPSGLSGSLGQAINDHPIPPSSSLSFLLFLPRREFPFSSKSVSKEQLRSIPFSPFLLLISCHTCTACLAGSFMWFHRIPS